MIGLSVSIFLVVLYFAIVCVTTAADFELNPLANGLLATAHPHVELINLAAKTVFLLASAIIVVDVPKLQALIFAASMAVQFYATARWVPFFTGWVNHVRSGFSLGLTWVSIMMVILRFVDEYEVEVAARVCRTPGEAVGTQDEASVKLAERILKSGILQFPQDPYAHVLYSNLRIEVQNLYRAGQSELMAAKKLNPGYVQKFAIFVREQQHAQRAHTQATGENAVDLVSYVEFQKWQRLLGRATERALTSQQAFWKLLLRSRIHFSQLTTAFNNIKAAQKNATQTYRMVLDSRADRLEEQQTALHDNMLVSADNRSMLTQTMLRIFGYKASELEGQNVNILMPQPFASRHAGYLLNYVNTGRTFVLDNVRHLVALHKRRYIFPIRLGVTVLSGQGADSIFLAVIQPIEADSGTIMVWALPNGSTLSVDQRFHDMFGITPSEVIGRNFKELVSEQEELQELMNQALASEDGVGISLGGMHIHHKYAGPVAVDVTIHRGGTPDAPLHKLILTPETPVAPPLLVLSRNGSVVFASNQLCQLLGYTARSMSMLSLEVRLTMSHKAEGEDNLLTVIQVAKSSVEAGLDERRVRMEVSPQGEIVSVLSASSSTALLGVVPEQLIGINVFKLFPDLAAAAADDADREDVLEALRLMSMERLGSVYMRLEIGGQSPDQAGGQEQPPAISMEQPRFLRLTHSGMANPSQPFLDAPGPGSGRLEHVDEKEDAPIALPIPLSAAYGSRGGDISPGTADPVMPSQRPAQPSQPPPLLLHGGFTLRHSADPASFTMRVGSAGRTSASSRPGSSTMEAVAMVRSRLAAKASRMQRQQGGVLVGLTPRPVVLEVDGTSGEDNLVFSIWQPEKVAAVLEVSKDGDVRQAELDELHPPGPVFGLSAAALAEFNLRDILSIPPYTSVSDFLFTSDKGAVNTPRSEHSESLRKVQAGKAREECGADVSRGRLTRAWVEQPESLVLEGPSPVSHLRTGSIPQTDFQRGKRLRRICKVLERPEARRAINRFWQHSQLVALLLALCHLACAIGIFVLLDQLSQCVKHTNICGIAMDCAHRAAISTRVMHEIYAQRPELFDLGQLFISSARDIQANHRHYVYDLGLPLTDTPPFRFIHDFGVWNLTNGYVEVLDTLVVQCVNRAHRMNELMLGLLVVEACLICGAACVYLAYRLMQVSKYRCSLFSVFLAIPTATIKALASRKVSAEDSDSDSQASDSGSVDGVRGGKGSRASVQNPSEPGDLHNDRHPRPDGVSSPASGGGRVRLGDSTELSIGGQNHQSQHHSGRGASSATPRGGSSRGHGGGGGIHEGEDGEAGSERVLGRSRSAWRTLSRAGKLLSQGSQRVATSFRLGIAARARSAAVRTSRFLQRKATLSGTNKTLLANTFQNWWLVLPILAWAVLIISLYAVSYNVVADINLPTGTLNAANLNVWRVTRLSYFAHELCVLEDPTSLPQYKEHLAISCSISELDWNVMLYGSKRKDMLHRVNVTISSRLGTVASIAHSNERLSKLLFSTRECLRFNQTTCFPPGHPFHMATHQGVGTVMQTLLQNCDSLLVDQPSAMNLRNPFLAFIFQVGLNDAHDGTLRVRDMYEDMLSDRIKHVRTIHIGLIVASYVLILIFVFYMVRPFVRYTREEAKHVAKLLSELGQDFDVERLVEGALGVKRSTSAKISSRSERQLQLHHIDSGVSGHAGT
ncbi:hypothetical protein GPECTOR_39g477 [Gonium pectorale]|uniref:PAS domain-containing protein n=1 Tax=Gonium pectorale TaxID=33097 RepID=A0A150GB40_GONPE|nr:hypothetical protein GPECTOR_39g477 [Gonium pectorale]|eukprot:KXZ46983.1 hypothetical protein GPECTOR_39g477 [Gonium pectorale]